MWSRVARKPLAPDQSADTCSPAGTGRGGGTVSTPTSAVSSRGSRRARVWAQYLGASSSLMGQTGKEIRLQVVETNGAALKQFPGNGLSSSRAIPWPPSRCAPGSRSGSPAHPSSQLSAAPLASSTGAPTPRRRSWPGHRPSPGSARNCAASTPSRMNGRSTSCRSLAPGALPPGPPSLLHLLRIPHQSRQSEKHSLISDNYFCRQE